MANSARTVGRYELLDVIGSGGQATVHLARQTDLDRLVALKELNDLEHGRSQRVARFAREAKVGGKLSHRNIVTVHEYFVHEGRAFIAMELIEHGSLRGHIGRLRLEQVGGVLRDILAALTYVAADDVVHRDIKPDNVLVFRDGSVKLADFGIARVLDATTTDMPLTEVDGILGSLEYMAPEQASGGTIGPWTDLFAVGVLAYELLVGERPFPSEGDPALVLSRLLYAPIRPPLEACPTLDPELAAWLDHMLEKEPDDRYREPSQAWDDLEPHLVRLCGARWELAAPINVEARAPEPPPAITVEALAPEPPPARPALDSTLPPADEPSDTTPGRRPRVNRLVALAAGLAALAASLTAVAAMLTGR